MTDAETPDYYEVLQVSRHADQDTIERVFRHLAKRLHPDNLDSGSAERFTQLMDAFRVLSDPEQRVRYDARYEQVQAAHWRVFNQEAAENDLAADRQMRTAILSLLYTSRRTDPNRPGMGAVQLEQILGCPEEHLAFHIWYLRENGWVQRLETGMLAITASGVDRVMDLGGPMRHGMQLLKASEESKSGDIRYKTA